MFDYSFWCISPILHNNSLIIAFSQITNYYEIVYKFVKFITRNSTDVIVNWYLTS